jgi:hypothetical protein
MTSMISECGASSMPRDGNMFQYAGGNSTHRGALHKLELFLNLMA